MSQQTYFDSAVLNDILARIEKREGRAFVLTLDGPGGSGKSTLAGEIAAAFAGSAVIVEGDDFYADLDCHYREGLDAEQGYEEYFDWQRLRDQVLAPASQGRPVRYQRYDWDNARMGEWVHVDPCDLLIVEGVYSARPQHREFADLVVWVTTSEEERLRRQHERGENDDIWIERWMAAENYYLTRVHKDDPTALTIQGQ